MVEGSSNSSGSLLCDRARSLSPQRSSAALIGRKGFANVPRLHLGRTGVLRPAAKPRIAFLLLCTFRASPKLKKEGTHSGARFNLF
jgi:hypothetical protein